MRPFHRRTDILLLAPLGFTLILILLMGGCRPDDRLKTYRWTSTGEGFDSVLIKMEVDFDDYAPSSELRRNLRTMDSLSRLAPSTLRSTMKARTLYWRARYSRRYVSEDSAAWYAKEAMALTDSSVNRYDWLRFKTQLYENDGAINGAERYRHYDETLKYAEEVGDLHMMGHLAVYMGNLMIDIGQPRKAEYFYDVSDSVVDKIGLWKLSAKNRINRASVLYMQGESLKADSIMESMRNHPALAGDTFTQNLIPRNLYSRHPDDTRNLREAYDQIKDNVRFRYLRGLYRALLAEHFFHTDQTDSMLHYGNLMMEDLPYVKDHRHRASIWYNRGLIWAWLGRSDSALVARVNYEACLDSVRIYEQANEVIRLDALEEMRRQEMRYDASLARRNWIILIVALTLLSGAAVMGLLLNRRNMRHRLKHLADELELEKAKRKMAAAAIVIEQKDTMLDMLRGELSDMRREGEIREASARRLEASIKSHLSNHDNEETFRNIFDTVNPGFTDRLRKSCPDLAESYLRLACYILMELDNKKIASLMMIKPESVRQARWRLRQRLGVPDGISLEDYLRVLNSEAGA